MDEFGELARRLREFTAVRDWEQFHTPKNLAMALAGEAGELIAELQWLTPEASRTVMADPEAGARVRSELADVFLYLTRLADVLEVDLVEAAHANSTRASGAMTRRPTAAPSVRRLRWPNPRRIRRPGRWRTAALDRRRPFRVRLERRDQEFLAGPID